jgi:hypothetical protein
VQVAIGHRVWAGERGRRHGLIVAAVRDELLALREAGSATARRWRLDVGYIDVKAPRRPARPIHRSLTQPQLTFVGRYSAEISHQ